MATIRRAGFGSVFEVENETVGIGTTGTATNTLQVLGETKTSSALISGLSTFTTYKGFVDKSAEFGNSNVDINSQSGTLGDIEICHGDFNVSSASTLTSSVNELTATSNFVVPTGNTDDRIHCHTTGSVRFNQDLATLEFYTGDEWRTVNSYTDIGRGRAVIYHGSTKIGDTVTDANDIIEYLNIASLGNTIDFGRLTVNRFFAGRSSSSTRGIFAGGQSSPAKRDVIDYVTMASEGDAIDFGNLSDAGRSPAGASSSTRGIIPGLDTTNTIEYIQISTLGDALDFGDLTNTNGQKGTACSSPTRLLYYSGNTSPDSSLVEFLTIASKGNTQTFGDLTFTGNAFEGGRRTTSASNQTRGLFAGGYKNVSPYTVHSSINYMTISSGGNATDFGNLTSVRYNAAATGSQTRAIYAGGQGQEPGFARLTFIDYIEYASSGNSLTFGELGLDASLGTANSDSHGGLGGY